MHQKKKKKKENKTKTVRGCIRNGYGYGYHDSNLGPRVNTYPSHTRFPVLSLYTPASLRSFGAEESDPSG